MQNDYISRETAKHDIVAWAQVITQPDLLSRDDALTALDCIPAADVRPVVRGEWIMNSDRPDMIICANCDKGFDAWKHESKDFRFCPNCGAEMGGQDNA